MNTFKQVFVFVALFVTRIAGVRLIPFSWRVWLWSEYDGSLDRFWLMKTRMQSAR